MNQTKRNLVNIMVGQGILYKTMVVHSILYHIMGESLFPIMKQQSLICHKMRVLFLIEHIILELLD